MASTVFIARIVATTDELSPLPPGLDPTYDDGRQEAQKKAFARFRTNPSVAGSYATSGRHRVLPHVVPATAEELSKTLSARSSAAEETTPVSWLVVDLRSPLA